MTKPPFITHEILGDTSHGFFTRAGGVSKGGYESLNGGFGSGDSRDDVSANRALAATAIGGDSDGIRSLYQIHSATIHIADPDSDTRPEGDGIVTAAPGLTLTILTADCVPVLLADSTAGVIGAAHAGWKGATGGVIPAVCDAMCNLGARREAIRAVIGPAIGAESYQVGEDVRDAVMAAGHNLGGASADDFIAPDDSEAGKFRFDLPGYGLAQLRGCGIGHSANLAIDTYTDSRFFSHRRHTHSGNNNGNGRMLSMIGLYI